MTALYIAIGLFAVWTLLACGCIAGIDFERARRGK